ncbi:hypothetical protein U0070_012903 [Myodes glareolus]|uniref:Uncharacterized protein n=1 Tax=Myodes glareolus TaxID=447135 RepID=A0AAW0IEV4_MYOGA
MVSAPFSLFPPLPEQLHLQPQRLTERWKVLSLPLDLPSPGTPLESIGCIFFTQESLNEAAERLYQANANTRPCL